MTSGHAAKAKPPPNPATTNAASTSQRPSLGRGRAGARPYLVCVLAMNHPPPDRRQDGFATVKLGATPKQQYATLWRQAFASDAGEAYIGPARKRYGDKLSS